MTSRAITTRFGLRPAPEEREAWDRLTPEARRRVEHAVYLGHRLSDPAEAELAAKFAARRRNYLIPSWWSRLVFGLCGAAWFGIFLVDLVSGDVDATSVKYGIAGVLVAGAFIMWRRLQRNLTRAHVENQDSSARP